MENKLLIGCFIQLIKLLKLFKLLKLWGHRALSERGKLKYNKLVKLLKLLQLVLPPFCYICTRIC